METVKSPSIILGLLSIVIGVSILFGWYLDIISLIQIMPGVAISDPLSGINFIAAGFTLCILGTNNTRAQKIIQLIFGIYLSVVSLIIILQTIYHISPGFDEKLFYIIMPQPFIPMKSMTINVAVNWLLIGFIFIMSASIRKKTPYMIMHLLTVIALMIAIIGFINYGNSFDLLYGWSKYLIMPFHTSVGMAIICIGLLGCWGQNKFYHTFYAGQEDRKILIFSGSLLIQVAITAGVIGFTINAQESEKFLKSSFDQALALKSAVFKEELKSAIDENNDFMKFPNIIEYFQTFPNVVDQTTDEITRLFQSQNIYAWRFLGPQGDVFLEQGHFKKGDGFSFPLKSQSGQLDGSALLVWSDGWYLSMQKDVIFGGQKIGSIIVEKSMKVLDRILLQERELGKTEEKILCALDKDLQYRCFSSSLNERAATIRDAHKIGKNNPISRAIDGEIGLELIEDGLRGHMIAAFRPIEYFGLGLVMKIELDEIYQNMYSQLKISIPMVLWFIIFSIVLLSWQVIPLVRRVILSEKDAIQNARLLSESEVRLRAIVGNIGEAILIVDEEEHIESLNEKALEIFGYTETQIVGQKIDILFCDESKKNTTPFFEKNISRAQWVEIESLRKNGSIFSAEFHVSEIKVRQKRIYVVILRDISERKRTENRIQESENRFRSSFDFAPIGMALISVDGLWVQVNQALCQIVGYGEKELLHTDFYHMTHADDLVYSREILDPVFQSSLKTTMLEKRYIHKNGHIVWVYLNVFMMNDDSGKPLYLIAQIQDITARKMVEEELKSANKQLKNKFDEMGLYNQEARLLSEMSRTLQSCLTVDEAYAPISSFSQQLMPHTSGILYFSQSLNHYMEPLAKWGKPLQPDDIFLSKDCWALRRGQIHHIDPTCPHIPCSHIHVVGKNISHMCIPMMAQGETIGLFYLEFLHDAQVALHQHPYFPPQDALKNMAQTIADQIALALSNIRLRETLQHQSIHDVLTGLFNRRYLEEFMRLEFLKASRKENVFSVIMLDVDHFKRFNDTFGHDAGDFVLQEIANVLQKNIRESDIACRLGGEEFILLLPDTGPEIAIQRAENIRQAIKKLTLRHAGRVLDPLSVSLGIALYPQHGSTSQLLLEAADQALYAAKKNGRDRLVMYYADQNQEEADT